MDNGKRIVIMYLTTVINCAIMIATLNSSFTNIGMTDHKVCMFSPGSASDTCNDVMG